MMLRDMVRAILAALIAAGALGPAGGRVSVSIGDGRFTPAVVNITVGQSVVWVNSDDVDHRLEAHDGSFASGNIRPGGSFEVRFARPGVYGYSCVLHPREKGTVAVKK